MSMTTDRSAPPTRAAAGSPAPFGLGAAATGFIKAYASLRGRQLRAMDAVAVQERALRRLVRKAANTRFGIDHGFAAIADVAGYQSRVPLRTYNQLWDAYWKEGFPNLVDVTWPGRLPFYAVSSGTSTGKVKYIPCSEAMVRANKRAALDTVVYHLNSFKGSRLFDGSFFVLGGSTDLVEQAPGVYSGDISGIAAFRQPWWSKPFGFPPPEVRFLTDWEQKLGRMAPQSLERRITGLSGSPAWMLVLFDKLRELKGAPGAPIAQLYPDLELIVHGGVSFAPYKKRFEAMLEGSRTQLREVYAASEGYVSIADRGPGEGMRLVLDNGMFLEFVPVEELGKDNPTRHWVGNLETGVDYAIALTTCAGLWSYLIGDIVRLVDRNPPRLLITGRTSYMLSSFGEHLTGELIETCVLKAAEEVGTTAPEFTVGTEVTEAQDQWGRHIYLVEFDPPLADPTRLDAFRQALDRELGQRNEDYLERRAVAAGLQEPVVHPVPPGFFNAWLKSQGKLGGQNKVPRVVGDQKVLEEMLAFRERRHGK